MSKMEKTSISVDGTLEKVELNQAVLPTWSIVVFLVVCFFVLKSFIYTKDDKRHGK
jgi:hypothetical protein